jgi:hypothetical protein
VGNLFINREEFITSFLKGPVIVWLERNLREIFSLTVHAQHGSKMDCKYKN